jgi:group I intron endonuclease
MYQIYKITNTINQKLYIGLTKQTLRKRFISHKTKSKNGSKTAIHRAFRFHGIEHFSIHGLAECTTLEEANLKEIEMIQQHNSLAPNGYNLQKGGDFTPHHCLPFNSEHKEKLRIAQQHNSKPITQFNIQTGEHIKTWPSGKDLMRSGFMRANIITLCKSAQKYGYAYGFGWGYAKTYDSVDNKSILSNPYYNSKGVTIQCYDSKNKLVKTYSAITAAAKELGCSPCSISDCLKGRAKTCKGFRWRYLHQEINSKPGTTRI